MSAELVRVARAEEQRLLRELEATPLFRRLERVRALLAEYESGSYPLATKVSPIRSRASGSSRANSLTAQVIAATADHLRQFRRRAQSAEILEVLQRRGIEVTGQKPTAVVASILSHCDLFDNVRGKGYGLAEWSRDPSLADSDSSSGEADSETEDPSSPDDHASAPHDTSGMDARSNLTSNGNWATNVDRSRPNPIQ